MPSLGTTNKRISGPTAATSACGPASRALATRTALDRQEAAPERRQYPAGGLRWCWALEGGDGGWFFDFLIGWRHPLPQTPHMK